MLLAALRFGALPASHLAEGDQWLTHLNVVAAFDHVSTSQVLRELWRREEAIHGGWFPLGPLPLSLWMFDLQPPVWKWLQFTFVLATFGTFGCLARQLVGTGRGAMLATAIALACWEYRTPHDVVLGTSLAVPFAVELALLAICAWLRHMDTGRTASLATAVTLSVAAMLCSPMGWAVAAVLVVLAVLASRRPAAYAFAAAFTLTLATQLLWHRAEAVFHHPGPVAQNVLAGILAPLPGSFRAFAHLPLVHGAPALWHGDRYVDDRFIGVPPVTLVGWLCAVVLAAVVAWGAGDARPHTARRPVLVLGLGLWLVPATFVGASTWWQHGIPLGQSLPVIYLQYFGVALVGAALASRLVESGPRTAGVVIPCIALAAFVFGFGNARSDAMALARTARLDEARSLIQRAGAAGFFDVLPEGATIAVASTEPFADGLHDRAADARYAFYHYSRRRFNVVSLDDVRAGRSVRGAWILRAPASKWVYVSLAHVAGAEGLRATADRAYAYVIFPRVWKQFETRGLGMATTTRTLRDGRAILVRRTCGPVPEADVLEEDKPTYRWLTGAVFPGPAGPYATHGPAGRPVPWGAGYYSSSGRVYLERRATLEVRAAGCGGVVVARGGWTAVAPSTVNVTSFHGTTKLSLGAPAQSFELRFPVRARQVFRVAFQTDAPVADFNPLVFRYEHDRPRKLRVIIDPFEVLQTNEGSRR